MGNPGTTNSDGTPRTARSFVTWNTAPISDALVSSAKLSLWNFHSGNTDCKAYPWGVYSTGKASTASRRTSQPARAATASATSTETKGNPGCTAAPDGRVRPRRPDAGRCRGDAFARAEPGVRPHAARQNSPSSHRFPRTPGLGGAVLGGAGLGAPDVRVS